MRICLVSHGFPPSDRTGVEQYTEALAGALTRAGCEVLVFAARRDDGAAHLSLQFEERDGYQIHWLALSGEPPEDPGEALRMPDAARAFRRVLEAERPELVHFQHVIKIGLACLDQARDFGVPIVYTAHDYFSICHRYTLLRPDLSHCEVRGDSMSCSECDLAVGFLNEHEELGDYQAGVFPQDLAEEDARTLAGVLEGRADEVGWSIDATDGAFDRRSGLDAQRARSFAAVDLFLAPSAYLAAELVRGGIERERIETLSYGIRIDDLRGLPAAGAEARSTNPVRFGFFGGLSKHKGVHHVLEAFGRMNGRAELFVFGYSTDAPYVERLRELASRHGAVWRGAYERDDLPELLAEVDVVIVPSVWVENQPIVIREAFAAGRPVLASDLGAMPESVRHDVDGLLFAPGDPDALAAALERVSDPAEVRRLAAGIPPIKDADEQAAELLERYRTLVGARRARRDAEDASLPASLASFRARVRELEELPLRGLFERVLGGLEGLRRRVGPNGGQAAEGLDALLARALGRRSKARHELGLVREERRWLKGQLEAAERDRGAGGEEREWLRQQLTVLTEERDWLKETVAAHEKELEWLRPQVEGQRAQLEELQAEVAGKELEIGREVASTSELALAAIEAQEQAVRDRVLALAEALGLDGQGATPDASFSTLLELLEQAAANGRALRDEAHWRRGEMHAAHGLLGRRAVRTLVGRTGLGRRIEGWADAAGDPPTPAASPQEGASS